MSEEKAIIIGAGPAGLTAGYELLERTAVVPLLIEKSDYIGGLARTWYTRAIESTSVRTDSSQSPTGSWTGGR